MVQSVNAKALLTLASVVRRPALLVPHVAVRSISDIDFPSLKKHASIQAIIFDKDNTLTAPYESSCVHPVAQVGLENAINTFGKDKIAILSNSAGTLDDYEFQDAERIERTLGISVIRHKQKKPGGLNEVLQHFELYDPATICMIGDRVLTDIVFGNLYGMLTIHTQALCHGPENIRDNWIAKIIRPIENKFILGEWRGGTHLRNLRLKHKYWSGPVIHSLRMGSDNDSDGNNLSRFHNE